MVVIIRMEEKECEGKMRTVPDVAMAEELSRVLFSLPNAQTSMMEKRHDVVDGGEVEVGNGEVEERKAHQKENLIISEGGEQREN
jgi:hypothetical protein